MTPRSPKSVGQRRLLAVLLGSVLLAGLLPGTVLAAASVTSATGGGAISADTADPAGTPPGNGSYTSLTGPSIVATGAGDIGAGTITIAVPAGFEFATSPDPTVGVGTTGAAIGFTSATIGVLTFTVTGANTAAGTVTFSGVRVRPTAGRPLASGELQMGGTAVPPDTTAGTLAEVPGAAQLSYQTSPSTSATAGTALATQPVVLSQDQFTNLRSGDSITLTSVPSTGGFSCTTNPKSTNGSGLASFATEACKFNNQGSYVIRATGPGGAFKDSATITVAPAAATKLVFITQPGLGTPSTTLSPQPVVAIQDNFGNTVATASATITLSKVAPDLGGPGSLVGCSSAPTVSGVATFSGCRIDTAGVGYRLTATDTTGGGAPHPYTLATSNKSDVRDRLVFSQQPAGAAAGVAFTTQPTVQVRAGPTDIAANDSSTVVTLSLSGGPAGAALTCASNPMTASAGVAAFSGCKIDKIGTYTVVASASGLGTVSSSSLTVAAGPATKLGFTAQPTSGVTAQAFPIQPVVAVQDAGGNTVTSGTNSTATVALSLGAGAPAGAVLTCTGGLSKVAVAGVAIFAGCAINAAGTYTLVATASGLTTATSSSFVVTVPVAAITLSNSASVITWGNPVNLTIQFGTNGGNKSFALQAARDGVSFVTIANLTTNSSGQAAFTYRPATNLYYKVVFAGTLDLSAATSNTTRTVVRQIALLRPHHSSTTSIARNTSITFTTTVRPSRPELPAAKVSFVLYRKVGSVWTRVTTRNVFIDSFGKASTTFKFTRAGSWYVRSIANPTPYNANSVWSPLERYSVR